MHKIENEIACKECGLILKKPIADYKHQFNCPRCNALVYRFGQNYTLIVILAITSLILFFPSIFLPLLTLKILDISQTTTLIETLIIFINDGYVLLAVFITFIGLLIPFTMLVLILLILFTLHRTKSYMKASKYLKLYKSLLEWQMAEVYLISIFVSIIKLQKMAELEIGIGLYFFIAFLLSMLFTMSIFNPYDVWREDEL